MHFRFITTAALCVALSLSVFGSALAQGGARDQSDLSAIQRLDLMRSKLDSLHRSLNNAIASMDPKTQEKGKTDVDDPRTRLRGLDKEVDSNPLGS